MEPLDHDECVKELLAAKGALTAASTRHSLAKHNYEQVVIAMYGAVAEGVNLRDLL